MNDFKRILGIVLLGFALLFLFRIPKNYQSTDPKASGHLGADVVFVLVFGASGAVLISSSRKQG